jgi:hypothetical protein
METSEEMTQGNERLNDSSDSGDKCCSSGWKSWKTAIFVLVILAAGAVAARSVLTNGNEAGSPCGVKSGCPLNKSCGASEACESEKAGSCGPTCPFEKKANNPSSACPKTETSSCCPISAAPDGCPKTEASSCCPTTTAAPGCCPQTGSN